MAGERQQAVLRHIVMFKYKENTLQDSIDAVGTNFLALQGKIPGILSIEKGIQNSPEGLDQDFTDIFQVTFDSKDARDRYLPHPEHQALIKTYIEPIVKEPFVIDYLSDSKDRTTIKKDGIYRHIVVFKYKEGTATEQIIEMEEQLMALKDKIPGIISAEKGKNNSPEGLDQSFTHVYQFTFEAKEARDTYLTHAEHQYVISNFIEPILDKVLVVDYKYTC